MAIFMEQYFSNSYTETVEIGRKLANSAPVFLIYGDLGSGKTALTKGICEGLGGSGDAVSSPTFAIVNEYEVQNGTLFHMDAYRLTAADFENGEFDYCFDDGVCVVEWAENLPDGICASNFAEVKITGNGDEQRRICVEIFGN